MRPWLLQLSTKVINISSLAKANHMAIPKVNSVEIYPTERSAAGKETGKFGKQEDISHYLLLGQLPSQR